MQTLEEIMNGSNRIVLFHGDELFITWNRSLILEAWAKVDPGKYQEISARTLEDKPDSIETAIDAAKQFYYTRTDER